MKTPVPTYIPAAALAPKNNSNGPRSIASLRGVVGSAGRDLFATGSLFIRGLEPGDGAGETIRTERLEIVDTLSDADGIDGNSVSLGDDVKSAAPRGAVELGDDEAGHARDLLEHLDLGERILPRGGVEHEQHAVRCGLVELFQNAHDLGELRHQIALVLQPPGGVDQEHILAFGAGALQRLIGDAGRVGPDILGDDLDADAPAPKLQLIDRRGTERIPGSKQHAVPLSHEVVGELRRSRGLAGAVYT